MECADAELALAALFDVRPYPKSTVALQRHVCTCDACRASLMWLIMLRGMEKIASNRFQERARARTRTAPRQMPT